MELPSRTRGDELLPAGEMTGIRARLRCLAPYHDLTTVIACAFDHRTRVLPYIYADMKIVPAGVRAIGSAMADAGFNKTRIVLQQWNKRFQPSQMRLDGRIPDIFMVSSMQIHASECQRLIQDACRIDPNQRPLIIVGGPLFIYEPWYAFSADPANPWAADVAVTGEEYVLLSLLEVLLSMRAGGESLRSTFIRARDSGALETIPGLVYGRSSGVGQPTEELIDTGVQRLLGDLDELPHPVHGYRLLEAPSRRPTLASQALPSGRVHKHCLVSSIVLTFGCKFRCGYCPIPAYNQRQYRSKSGERVADEVEQIANTYKIHGFFGTDDNFFNDTNKTLDIVEALARRARAGQRPFCKIRWGTEATVHDTIRLKEHLPVIRESGLTALWVGVEDITASLVRKGQNEDKTLEAFQLLRENGIFPMPMMMHHDSQPLVTWTGNYGLINQLKVLRKAGAISMQVLMLMPSVGSKWYEDTYRSGMAFQGVGKVEMEPYMINGSYVVASKHPQPWKKQLNLLVGYAYFYNPIRFLFALLRSETAIPFADAETRPEHETRHYSRWVKLRRRIVLKSRAHLFDAGMQLFGMCGLFHTFRRTIGWAGRLLRGNIQRYSQPPTSWIPMLGVDGRAASHDLPRESNIVTLQLSQEESGEEPLPAAPRRTAI